MKDKSFRNILQAFFQAYFYVRGGNELGKAHELIIKTIRLVKPYQTTQLK